MRAQVNERIVVLVGIVAHGVADAVGYVVLQPALLDGQYLVEGVGNVEAYRIHLLVHHILPDLFRREPALVGESKLKLVAVELRFCGTEYRRYFRELHFSDAGKVVRYLLLLVSYLFRIGEHLPFAAAAYTVVLTERNGSYR